jgi:LCP family protein required for cell wall assembly
LLPVTLTALALLMVGVLFAGMLYAFTVDQKVNENLQRGASLPADLPTEPGAKPRPKPRAGKAQDYVLIGADQAGGGVSRSDALMVLHLAGDRRSAYLISFPRDLWVRIPGHGHNKINAAYAFGGSALTIRTLEDLLDVRMDHVAEVDFAGFVALADEVGGVRVYNIHPSRFGGYAFPAGHIALNGDQALAYVRERKTLPRGDLDRAERQRAVVTAILAKGLSGDTISNPRRFIAFTSGMAEHLTVDAELTPKVLRQTALSLRLAPDDLASLQAPVARFGRSADGQSIDVVDQAKMAELATALQNDTMADYLERYPG